MMMVAGNPQTTAPLVGEQLIWFAVPLTDVAEVAVPYLATSVQTVPMSTMEIAFEEELDHVDGTLIFASAEILVFVSPAMMLICCP